MAVAGCDRGFLSLLSPQLFQRLTSEAVQHRFEDGQHIHVRGDLDPGFTMVRKGRVRIGSMSPAGHFIEFGLLRPGDVFGEMTVILEVPRLQDSLALGQTVVDQLSLAQFRTILDESDEFRTLIMRLLARRLQHAHVRIDQILRLPLVDRVGRHLLDVNRRLGGRDAVQLRQSEVAEAMGASRVSVSKALGQLAELNFVGTGYGQIDLTDKAGLKKWLDARHKVDEFVE
jgi:CRP/FNR family transcriptional regulator, cyclic AMP receptor protein